MCAREHRGEDHPSHDGGRGGGEGAEFARPVRAPGVLADRVDDRVVAELEDVVAADHGRELEQRAEVVHPKMLEGGMQAWGRGEEARVFLGVAVEGPGEAILRLGRKRRCVFGDEAGVGVIDAPRAVALVEIDAEGDPAEQQQHAGGESEAGSF